MIIYQKGLVLLAPIIALSVVVIYLSNHPDSPQEQSHELDAGSDISPVSAPASSPLSSPVTSPIQIDGDIASYEHPELKFSFVYLSSWEGEVLPALPEVQKQKYDDFRILSRDYHLSTQNPGYDGIEYIDGGAEIRIGVRIPTAASIEEEYSNDEMLQFASSNKKDIEVYGIPAIQYDYGIENVEQVVTRFVYDENEYIIVYGYALGGDRAKYFDVYQQVLDSFQFAE